MTSLAWQLARRYRSTRHTSAFIRFISASSTLGVGLGVAVLILALSVMNGFEQALEQRLLSVMPHVELEAVNHQMEDWQRKAEQFRQLPQIRGVAPYIKANGMLRQGQQVKAAQIRGIVPASEQQISDFADYLSAGSLASLGPDQVVLGKGVAEALNVSVGQSVQLMLPEFSDDGRLSGQTLVNLQVSAIIAMGGQLDYSQVWVDMPALAEWLHQPPLSIHGLAFRIEQVFQAPAVARLLGQHSEDYVYLLDWFRSQGHVYNDIQMVRIILHLVLALVIAVACFNIVATLVMAVREKEADIAILLTMGTKPSEIIKAFMWLGWMNGITGACGGVVAGVLLANYIEDIFAAVTKVLGHSLLDPTIYFIDFVPSLLRWQDVLLTFGIAVVMSLLATLYPAWRASKVQPARVLGQR